MSSSIEQADQHGSQEQLASVIHAHEAGDDTPLSDTMQQLPSHVTRGLLYLFLLFLVVTFIYASLNRVDITRTASATVIPEGKIKPIQPSVDGVVSEVLVREGDKVVRGQQLAVVESREVGTSLSALWAAEMEYSDAQREVDEVIPLKEKQTRAQVEILRSKIANLTRTAKLLSERIENEVKAAGLTAETYRLQVAQQDELVKRLNVEQKNAALTEKLWVQELGAVKALFERKAASQLQFLSTQRSKEAATGELEKIKSSLREATQQRQIMGKQFESAKNKHQQQLVTLREQLAQNGAEIESTRLQILQLESEVQLTKVDAERKLERAQFRHTQTKAEAKLNLRGVNEATLESIAGGTGSTSNRSVLRAPLGGRIGQVLVRNAGETVTRGTTIMTLVPEDVRRIAELKIRNQDIGLVEEGLPVKLKFDAFPFAEYGVITGEVTKIVPTAEDAGPTQPSTYRAYASLDQDYFLVKGERVALLAGMTATAEITTEKKTLLALVLEPFQELGKPKSAQR